MRILASIEPENFYTPLHELVRMTFAEHEIYFKDLSAREADLIVILQFTEKNGAVFFNGQIENFIRTDQAIIADNKEDTNRTLRKILFRFFSEYKARAISEYGVLTGVRPVKIVHRMLDQGLNDENVLVKLQQEYYLSKATANRLLTIARNNRFAFTPEVLPKQIGLYIGIPFCSSKCYYCSFPGAIVKKYESEILPFLSALEQEINEIGAYLTQHSYQVDTIYFGGGTPSILRTIDLQRVFSWLDAAMPWAQAREITFEAGRPDSLASDKIQQIVDWGVNRICINPQSMHDMTLSAIGRKHTSDDIAATVEMVRRTGALMINMDLILGLPGEGISHFQQSIERVLALNPENITVHSLAVKKGSALKDKEGIASIHNGSDGIREGAIWIDQRLQQAGYIPYYLYRQKYIKENLDNVGYALPGSECIYNIRMMEEKQTILGLGGGASSKLINPITGLITAYHNPKEPAAYITNISRHIMAKLDKL